MEIGDIQHLAELSRIGLTDAEATELATEFDSILAYVAQVTEVSADAQLAPVAGVHANVMREDTETHAPGAYTDALLSATSQRDGQYVHVKKILEGKTIDKS